MYLYIPVWIFLYPNLFLLFQLCIKQHERRKTKRYHFLHKRKSYKKPIYIYLILSMLLIPSKWTQIARNDEEKEIMFEEETLPYPNEQKTSPVAMSLRKAKRILNENYHTHTPWTTLISKYPIFSHKNIEWKWKQLFIYIHYFKENGNCAVQLTPKCRYRKNDW